MRFFYKILLGYVAVVVLLALVFVGAIGYNLKKNTEDKDSYREREVTSFVEVLDAVIDSEEALNKAGFAQGLIDGVMDKLQHIKRFSIHAKAPLGQTKSGYWHLASSEKSRIGKDSDPEDIEALHKKIKKVLYETDSSGKRSIDITYPISDANANPIATVGITVSLADEDEIFSHAHEKIIQDSIKTAAIMLSIIMVLALLLSVFLARRATAPLKQFKEYTRKVSEGNFRDKLNIKTGDEFEELSNAFNAMSAELLALYENLEQKIDERTMELTQEVEMRQEAEEELLQLNQELDRQVKEGVEKNLKQELMLVQQSKMAMMGEMIGAIAHQWRQPLNSLGITIQDVGMAYKFGELNDEYIKNYTQDAMRTIQTMSSTIDDFKNFFSPNKKQEEFYLEDVIDDALKILSSQFKIHSIDVVFDRNESNGHKYRCYKNELKQVLLNILANAKDALLEKKQENSFVNIAVNCLQEYCEISIEDSAGGIPEEIMDKIFESHFTTKTPDKGTGIGLYMSKEIVENSLGGKLIVESTSNGAKFTIRLPL